MSTVIDANPAAPAPDTNGDQPSKKHKGPPTKDAYPALADGAKLTSVPEDFNPKKHKSLTEDDFEGSALDKFYRYKQAAAQKIADNFGAKAERFARLGGISDKKTAMKVDSTMQSLAASLKALIEQGDPGIAAFPDAMFIACGLEPPVRA